jgi:hypothetical protein
MTAGLESRFKQTAYSRLCSKVSGINPRYKFGLHCDPIFGSLELLQDYLKIAMESKKRAEHYSNRTMQTSCSDSTTKFRLRYRTAHLLIYQTYRTIARHLPIFRLAVLRRSSIAATEPEYQGVPRSARHLLWFFVGKSTNPSFPFHSKRLAE